MPLSSRFHVNERDHSWTSVSRCSCFAEIAWIVQPAATKTPCFTATDRNSLMLILDSQRWGSFLPSPFRAGCCETETISFSSTLTKRFQHGRQVLSVGIQMLSLWWTHIDPYRDLLDVFPLNRFCSGERGKLSCQNITE